MKHLFMNYKFLQCRYFDCRSPGFTICWILYLPFI